VNAVNISRFPHHSGLPQVMKAMVKLPEEVPKEMIWNTTYHTFRYWLPFKQEGAVGGAARCDGEMVSERNGRRPLGVMNTDRLPSKEIAMKPRRKELLRPIGLSVPSSMVSEVPFRCSVGAGVMQIEPNAYKLDAGTILVAENFPSNIVTPHGTVNVAKGAVVMITATPTVTYVRDLVDNAKNDVSVTMENRVVTLTPGQEAALVVGPGYRARDMVFGDTAARRDVRVHTVGPERHIVTADFSHLNLMLCDNMLGSLRKSNSNADKQLFAKMMKTAAAITTVYDRTRAPYAIPFEPTNSERVAAKANPPM
jgi:hypothetical protein